MKKYGFCKSGNIFNPVVRERRRVAFQVFEHVCVWGNVKLGRINLFVFTYGKLVLQK